MFGFDVVADNASPPPSAKVAASQESASAPQSPNAVKVLNVVLLPSLDPATRRNVSQYAVKTAMIANIKYARVRSRGAVSS
jgi:hypothetical protein